MLEQEGKELNAAIAAKEALECKLEQEDAVKQALERKLQQEDAVKEALKNKLQLEDEKVLQPQVPALFVSLACIS